MKSDAATLEELVAATKNEEREVRVVAYERLAASFPNDLRALRALAEGVADPRNGLRVFGFVTIRVWILRDLLRRIDSPPARSLRDQAILDLDDHDGESMSLLVSLDDVRPGDPMRALRAANERKRPNTDALLD